MKITGIIFLVIGIASIFIQKIFYGYIDAEGFIHDSIFLPLGALATIIGSSCCWCMEESVFTKN